MTSHRHGIATLSGLAAIAFVVACFSHEAIGHGLACLSTGGSITLLTSVYFHCQPSVPLDDAAGPLMNLAVAAIAAMLLHRGEAPSNRSTFLGLLLAYSGGWGAGYFILSAVTGEGDWGSVLRDLSLQPAGLWRVGMAIAGIWLYARILRRAAMFLPKGMPLFIAYLAAALVACLSVVFRPGPVLPALREAAQEGLLAPVGLLFTAFRSPARAIPLPLGRPLIWASIVIVLIFWLVLGRGIRG